MATYLSDTNVLLRLADPASPQHSISVQSLTQLFLQSEDIFLTPQNFIEFWAVATRPLTANGFGWSRERTVQEVTELQKRFPLLPDSPEVFTRWLELVKDLPISGKRVHDARLVAVLQVYAVANLITFKLPDFSYFKTISVIHPLTIISAGKKYL